MKLIMSVFSVWSVPRRRRSMSDTEPTDNKPSLLERLGALTESRDGRVALLAAACYLLLFNVSPLLPLSGYSVIAALTLVSLILVLLFTVTAARAMRTGRASNVSLVLAGLLAVPYVLMKLLSTQFPEWNWQSILQSPLVVAYFRLLSIPGVIGLFLIWFATCVGVLIARLVREMKILLPMAVVLALVDLYVVFGGGLVTQAQSGNAPVAAAAANALTVALPAASPKTGAAPMQLAVGFADFLFIATFFTCFARFGVPSRRTFITLCIVLTGYMMIVAIREVSLPALVPIAVVIIGMNLRHFRYSREESFAMLYAGIIVAAVLGFLVVRSQPTRETARSSRTPQDRRLK
jgi:hypothetical protein